MPHEIETHTFDLSVSRRLTDAEIDDLLEAADDVTPERAIEHTVLHFDREAATLEQAIVTAVHDVERAGLRASGVGTPDLVDLPDIAARTGRTRSSIRLLAAGLRGPGTFPRPDEGLYSWTAVRAWFAAYDPVAVDHPDHLALAHDAIIAAADHVVRARALLPNGHAGELTSLLPT